MLKYLTGVLKDNSFLFINSISNFSIADPIKSKLLLNGEYIDNCLDVITDEGFTIRVEPINADGNNCSISSDQSVTFRLHPASESLGTNLSVGIFSRLFFLNQASFQTSKENMFACDSAYRQYYLFFWVLFQYIIFLILVVLMMKTEMFLLVLN